MENKRKKDSHPRKVSVGTLRAPYNIGAVPFGLMIDLIF